MYIEDREKDTLLYVKTATASFKFFDFFKGKILFTAIELNHLKGNIAVNKKGITNFDFIIQALKSPKKDSSTVEYRIKKFNINNSVVSYTDTRGNKTVTKKHFNPFKIRLENFNADFELNILKKDTMNLVINNVSCTEKSGFSIQHLTTQIIQSKKGIKLPTLKLELPNSKLYFADIEAVYDSISDAKSALKNSKWQAPLLKSKITLQDLSAFVPEFKNIKKAATIQGKAIGKMSSLRFKDFRLAYGKTFNLDADLDINGLSKLNDAFIYCNINKLSIERNETQDIIAEITGKPFLLPKELNQLGTINYSGNITGFFSNLVAYGNIKTKLGAVSTDILLKFDNTLKDLNYKGMLETNNFQFGQLLNNKSLGKISFKINIDGVKMHKKPFKGSLKAILPELYANNYLYKDIELAGKYDGTGFNGEALIKDKNVNANFKGIFDLSKKLPVFDFFLKVTNANLFALNLIDKYPSATLSFQGKTNMIGRNLDNINGKLRFDSILLVNNNKTLNIEEIQFESKIIDNYTNFQIKSDFVNGKFYGNFKYSTVGLTINRIIQNYLPSFATDLSNGKNSNDNNIQVDLKIENTKEISNVLDLNYTLEGISTIKGRIDDRTNQISFDGLVPLLKTPNQKLENISVRLEKVKQNLQLSSRAQLHDKTGLVQLFMLATAANDSVSTNLGWQNAQQITNAGEISAVTKFRKEIGNKLAATMLVRPSKVIINDSTWDIRNCKIDFNADSTIQVHNFKFENSKQFIHINGAVSSNSSDSITVDMNDLDLEFILRLIRLKGIYIGGYVSGNATFYGLLKHPIYEANLFVKKAQLNHKDIGNVALKSFWDSQNKLVILNGHFFDNNDKTIAFANGVYVPKKDSIDVTFDAQSLNVEFLSRYFDGVASNFKGWGNGKIRMFGPMKYIKFEGDVLVKNGQFTMDVLKTTYHFNDTVKLTTNKIDIKNIKIFDDEKNQGILNGSIHHNGYFQKMNYNVSIKGKNVLAMNTASTDNSYFYGKAYVTGNVNITGNEKNANIFINGVTRPKTKCFVQMDGASSANDNSFINFVNNTKTEKTVEKPKVSASQFNVNVDMQIDVTPDAEMELIVDAKAGDKITGKGNGNIRVQFDSFSDIKLYGTYILEQGNYLFTLQTLIRKEFKINKGSTIAWTGDPFHAQVNINALYPLTASLSDLMDKTELETTTTRNSVPVNCILKLTDDLMAPTIKFDIDLPSSDEGIKQKVRSIINTEEMMNRQIAYLLLLNKFYTPDYLRTSPILGVNEGLSFATSTLSAHFNNWIKQSFNTNNLSVGFDWQKSETVSDEFKAQVLYQPNKRLIVNGNFGYRNENVSASTNNNKFIGDFDVEWLLSESGKLRFKAYSHTIDRAQLREAKTTQGVGLGYKEDFISVSDMINYYWKLITSPFNNKTK